MQVRQLTPGDEFAVDLGKYGKLEYRLLYTNDCRSYVEPLKKQTRTVDILDDVERGGRVNISPNTECTMIDQDLEDFMGTSTATTKKKDDKKIVAVGKDPRKQEKPMKEGTIRANILAAVKAGENNLDKLAKKFNTTRTNIGSHIRDMWRFHGYGFSFAGDVVKIVPPVGGVLKSKPAKQTPAVKPAKKSAIKKDILDDDEDDFLS